MIQSKSKAIQLLKRGWVLHLRAIGWRLIPDDEQPAVAIKQSTAMAIIATEQMMHRTDDRKSVVGQTWEWSQCVSATCPCGQEIPVNLDDRDHFDVCNVACERCGRRSTGGNWKTGEITHWITPEVAADAEAEFQRQQLSADMNDMLGRGNHPF